MLRTKTLSLMLSLSLLGATASAFAADPEAAQETNRFDLEQSGMFGTPAPFQIPTIRFATQPDHGTTWFGLPQNMGPMDRILRGVIAVGLVGTGIYGLSSRSIPDPVNWTLIGVAAIPTATAASGYCPLYQLFGLDYSF